MTAKERAAVTRILIDLVKADKVIDSREMNLYASLKLKYSIVKKNEVEAYAMTLGEAVGVLKEMDPAVLSDLLCTFEEMTVSDGISAREEALLMLALKACLGGGDRDCDVISNTVEDVWFDERQVLYVESRYDRALNDSIERDYRAVSRELKMCGLDFVYLPKIVAHYAGTPEKLFNEVASLLSPSLSQNAITGLLEKIKLIQTDTFCIEQLHHKLGFRELADTPPALLVRISQSRVGDKFYTNFLRVELEDDVLPTVQRLVDIFLGYHTVDQLVISNKKDERGSFLYKGFYRQIFEILLLQKSVTCHLLVDFVHGRFMFPEIDVVLSGLHRKEKALYVLFLYEAYSGAVRGGNGEIKLNGGISFTAPKFRGQMEKFDGRMARLQRRYARVYEAFGGDGDKAPDITSAEIRLPMISRIRRVINRQSEKIYDAARFIVNRDPNGVYSLTVNPASVTCKDFSSATPVILTESTLFAELDRL